MLQKIKTLILSLSMLGLFAAPILAAVPAYAADCGPGVTGECTLNSQGTLCAGSNFSVSGAPDNGASGQPGCNDNTGTNSLGSKIAKFINIFSAIVGIAAVIIIIYAGFRYVTSAGSQDGIKSAKDAIIYAIVGLVVVALAQAIVHFVINNIS